MSELGFKWTKLHLVQAGLHTGTDSDADREAEPCRAAGARADNKNRALACRGTSKAVCPPFSYYFYFTTSAFPLCYAHFIYSSRTLLSHSS